VLAHSLLPNFTLSVCQQIDRGDFASCTRNNNEPSCLDGLYLRVAAGLSHLLSGVLFHSSSCSSDPSISSNNDVFRALDFLQLTLGGFTGHFQNSGHQTAAIDWSGIVPLSRSGVRSSSDGCATDLRNRSACMAQPVTSDSRAVSDSQYSMASLSNRMPRARSMLVSVDDPSA
jgi:hypothetical protein